MSTVAVIDYGGSNLRSVVNALECMSGARHRVVVSDAAAVIREADRVVFPGQGAIGDCMARLAERGLIDIIRECARTRPFFGICLGLQSLLSASDEDGGTTCLGLFPGTVVRFPLKPTPAPDGLPRKVLGEDAAHLLSQYSWPGNVRELQNLMQRLAVLSREDVISSAVVRQILPAAQISHGHCGQTVDQLQDAVRAWAKESLAGRNGGGGADEILHDALLCLVEPVLLKETLLSVDGNQIKAAQLLGINRNTLRKKLNDYGLDPVDLRRGE